MVSMRTEMQGVLRDFKAEMRGLVEEESSERKRELGDVVDRLASLESRVAAQATSASSATSSAAPPARPKAGKAPPTPQQRRTCQIGGFPYNCRRIPRKSKATELGDGCMADIDDIFAPYAHGSKAKIRFRDEAG
eukprot:UN4683